MSFLVYRVKHDALHISISLLFLCHVQIEWLTAGECTAGMHEVVVTKRTIDAMKLASEQNHSLWRVSSTVSELNHILAIKPAFEKSIVMIYFLVLCSCLRT